MPMIDLKNTKSIILCAKDFHGNVVIKYAPSSYLMYQNEDIEIKTSKDQINEKTYIDIKYEKGVFFSKFFLFSQSSHTAKIDLFVNEEVTDISLDINSADIDINFDDTNIQNLSIKTIAGDINIDGKTKSKNLKELYINTKAGDVDLNLQSSQVEETTFKSASGDFKVNNAKLYNIKFDLASGDVLILNSIIENLEANFTSGDISIKDSKVKNVKIHAISGDIDIDYLLKDFNCEIKGISSDIYLNILGKEKIFLYGNTNRFASSLKSNLDIVTIKNSTEESSQRLLKIDLVSGDLTIKAKELNEKEEHILNKESNLQQSFYGDDLLTLEEKKILELLKEGKISRIFALELLKELGYSNEEGEKFLKERGL
ncbi:DUF4097 family beta strand repeat-containing protein [Petrotoga sp. 9PWA.NaAc.5.4]|uniref:DUF4097 family beta strand repeat-containing protein n=1 Tax=Petrotoga sp. 9PWA.NaAc.5.4 TaxID=1434328 RepID=UPI000CABF817|nr:DUF4097 family beta strand repeat-containing protein [Petrotoga sp. 9PWA.NaAc.5.4]PNR92852.1 hypothetical protein X924_08620 [Petrotoga sp. 9PWA.NaAc.5.4]